ncbi:MAG: hypothetical protein AB1656_25270 [Candidatus Omnitrophota bacterium]
MNAASKIFLSIKPHQIINRFSLFLIVFVILPFLFSCGISSKKKAEVSLDRNPPPPAIGQLFTYRHRGPCPGGDGQTDASGWRIVRVVDKPPQKDSLWMIEERYEKDPGVYLSYCDDNYQLRRQIVKGTGRSVTMEFKPPQDIRYSQLAPGAEKRYSYRLDYFVSDSKEKIGFASISDHVRRDYDVRIITKAGAYLCRQFHSDLAIETTMGGDSLYIRASVESYWSDRIGWFVQQKYFFQPVTRDGEVVQPGYEAESILEDFEPKTW